MVLRDGADDHAVGVSPPRPESAETAFYFTLYLDHTMAKIYDKMFFPTPLPDLGRKTFYFRRWGREKGKRVKE